MGKRKHYANEEDIDEEIRKLRKKRAKIRRERNDKRRYRSYSSSSYSYSDERESDYHAVDYDNPEASTSKGAPVEDDYVFDNLYNVLPEQSEQHTIDLAPASPPEPAVASVVVPIPPSAPSDIEPQEATTSATDLDPSILCILGDEPVAEEKYGPNIQKEIASRWSDILINGLPEEIKKGIIKDYNAPENFKIVQAPIINPEIKAAVNENVLKRDGILTEKQKLLTTAITSVASTISTVLSVNVESDIKNNILKSLSDMGRILCHILFSETQVRRNFLLACLSKEVKDNIKDLKRDHLLFGNDLQENLKTMKAITKTGAELRPVPDKMKPPPKNRQAGPSTSKALNWRGPPPPPQAPPRRHPARPSSTAGGRSRPPPRARQHSDRRAPRPPPRTSRY